MGGRDILISHPYIRAASKNSIIKGNDRKRKTNMISIICRIQKDDTEELICKAEIETQMKEQMYGHQDWGVRGWDAWGPPYAQIHSFILCIRQIDNE